MSGRLRAGIERVRGWRSVRDIFYFPRTVGVKETLVRRFIGAFRSFFAAYLLLAISFFAIFAANEWRLPAEFGIVLFALIVFGVALALILWIPIRFFYRAVTFTLNEFTPPYTDGRIEFERSSSRLSGYIEWHEPAEKALSGTIIYYLLMVGWFGILRIWLIFEPDPEQRIDSILNSIPDVLSDVVINSIMQYTSIDLRTILEQIQDPSAVVLQILIIGSLVFFIGIGTWNLYYGIKLVITDRLG